MIRPPFVLLAYVLCLAPAAVGQEAGEPEIVGVRVGLGGRYKPGCWTPVEVTLRGAGNLAGGELALTVPDGDGVPSRVAAPLPCPALGVEAARADSLVCESARDGKGQLSVLLYARFGRVKSELAVELRTGDRLLDRRVFRAGDGGDYPAAVLSDQELIVTVGRASVGVEEAVKLLHQHQDRRTVVVRLEDFRQLPTRWYGYEGVDTVLLSTSEPHFYSDLTPTSPRVAALDEWVRMGGRLVLCVGRQAEEVVCRKPEAALAQFVPGRLESTVSLRLTNALEAYCGSVARVPPSKSGMRVPYLVDVRGKTEAAEGSLPLVVREARGFGQVVFAAVDLDLSPLAEWEDRGLFVGKLLNYPTTPVDEVDEGTAVMHFGFTDLAGQLRSALDQFPNVWLAPFSLVVGLMILYILAIGPGEYFFLRKVVRRMQLTWITFPLIVVGFTVTAYVLAERFKGDRVRVNQVDLVDVDVPSGRVRGTAWANVFSPRMGRYDFSFRPALLGAAGAPEAATLTAWLGLPGNALGGMDPRTVDPSVWKGHYEFSHELDALHDVPIQIWSTKSLSARWTAPINPPLEAQLTEEDGVPRGTIVNTLGLPLAECLLAYGDYAYELGTVEPGEPVRVGSNLKRRELKSLLTGRQIIFDEEKDNYQSQATPYDQASVDVGYILRAMMFFEAAGGRRYTGLSNRYQGFVDFSRLLKTNRAVLVARAETDTAEPGHHGAELWCNGQPVPHAQVRHTTIYRFVFPVEGGE